MKKPRKALKSPLSQTFLTPQAVMDATTLSRTTLWRMCRAGTFPAPVQVSAGRVAWRSTDVEAWMASREAPASLDFAELWAKAAA